MSLPSNPRIPPSARRRLGALGAAILMTGLASAQGGPPGCVIHSPAAMSSLQGEVTVSFSVADPDLDPVDVAFEFSTGGGFLPATPAASSPSPNPLLGVATPAGPLDFVWATATDLSGPSAVTFRIIVFDPIRLAGACTVSFQVDPGSSPPGAQAPTCAIIDPARGAVASGEVSVLFDVDDLNLDPVDVGFSFSSDAGATFLPATAAARSPLPNPSPGLPTPQVRATFVWDSLADGASGPIVFRIVATDPGGLTGSCTTDFVVCQIPPTIQPTIGLVGPTPPGGTYCRDVSFSVGAISSGCAAPDRIEVTLTYHPGAAGCGSIPPSGSAPLTLRGGQPVILNGPFGAGVLVTWDSAAEIPGACSGEVHAEITAVYSSCGSCSFQVLPPAVVAIDVDNTGTSSGTLCGGVCGDANQNGQVDAIDVLLIALYSLGCPPGLPCPTASPACMDLDASGSVDLIDALLAAQYSVGSRCGLSCP